MSIKVTPALIKKIAKGTIFGIEYTRKDGTTGAMTCRFGVKCHLTTPVAERKEYDPSKAPQHLITVYCASKKGYRKILIENIISMTVKGVKIDLRTLKDLSVMEAAKSVQDAMDNGFDSSYEIDYSNFEDQGDERLIA